jgi:flagellar biosynthesis protein FlhG
MSTKLWVVSAGKGGVGKTFVVSSLGITLSKLNQKVCLVDLDSSGGNLHSVFGLPLTDKNLRKYFFENQKLSELAVPTKIPHLSFIQGFWDTWSQTDLSKDQVHRFVEQIKTSGKFDFVIVDTTAGAWLPQLELFDMADERFLITNSEPTSVEKNYRFIESYLCFLLQKSIFKDNLHEAQAFLRNFRQNQSKDFKTFKDIIEEKFSRNENTFAKFDESPIRLIVNGTRSNQDEDLGFSIRSVAYKYFGLLMDYKGHIEYDNAVWQSIKNREPVLIEKPFTPLAGQFLSICKSLLNPNHNTNLFKEVV